MVVVVIVVVLMMVIVVVLMVVIVVVLMVVMVRIRISIKGAKRSRLYPKVLDLAPRNYLTGDYFFKKKTKAMNKK